MATGETHPRAKEPMNRAKNPLRRRAAPIGDELRPREEWERQGVYFLHEPGCLKHVIGHALGAQ